MINLFAQTEWLEAFKPYGLAGLVLAFFMGLHVWLLKVDKAREETREKARDEREERREGNLLQVAKALNHLTQAITLHMLAQPEMSKRFKEEAQSIRDSIGT